MEVIKTLIFIVFLSIGQISSAEILIYKVDNYCLEFNGVDGQWEKDVKGERGFLVLELNYLEDDNIDVNEAVQIMYWRDGTDKFYGEYSHNIDIMRVLMDRQIYWLLVEKNANSIDVQMQILMGPVDDNSEDISGEIANELSGTYLSDTQLGVGHYIDINNVTFRLDSRWTSWANEAGRGGGDFDYAVSDIVVSYLEEKRYVNFEK